MKKVRIFLTAVALVAVVGATYAFNAYRNGAYRCQATEGPCPASTPTYKIVTSGGQILFCDNGSGNGMCNNQRRVTADAR